MHKTLSRSRKSDLFGDLPGISFSDSGLRRATTYVLCCVIIVLTGFSITLNAIEGNTQLLAPLWLVILSVCIALPWLWINKNAEFGPLYICLGALATLGGFLLLRHGAPDGSSLYWFLLFPPMLMFSLGLRRGTIAFCAFLFFISLLLLTPLQSFLAEPLPRSVRIRFLAAMLGAFIFSCGAEYMRFQTHKALVRTLARLELDSFTDPLTGLGNRRDFYNFYNISFLGSFARKYPFALALADVDHFKNINDTYGHEVGDRVLCHVARILRGQCREADKLYRWGGEEFLILMPRTGAGEARRVLERMRLKLEETPYCTDEGEDLALTASFGMYEGSADKNLDWQIGAADQSLYAAKRGGRNQVV